MLSQLTMGALKLPIIRKGIIPFFSKNQMIQNWNIKDLSGFLNPFGQPLILLRRHQISTRMAVGIM